MKKIISVFIFLSILSGMELEIGSTMPKKKLELNDIEGNKVTLSDIKGENGTLIIFSCNTCPWVIKWEDRYLDIANKYIEKGIGMVAINSNVARFENVDSIEEMKKHSDKMNYNFTYAQDTNAELAYAFGATKTPHVYLFNRKNELVYRGAIDDNARSAKKVDEPFLKNALDQLLVNKQIKNTTSKAIGCSIKFN
jgi:peroxiredoxin